MGKDATGFRVRTANRRLTPHQGLRNTGEIMASRKQRPEKASPEDAKDARQSEPAETKPRRGVRQPRAYPDPVDDTLDDSFPASDPPSWAGQ